MTAARKLFAAPLLLVALFLAGCETSAPPALPTAPTGEAVTSAQVGGYTLVTSPLPDVIGSLSVSQLIGLNGGSVHLAGHSITIPAGAVTVPTVFTLTVLPTGYVEVHLTALSTSLLGRVVNVGANGFANGKTVTLTLSYAGATNVSDPQELVILRDLGGGAVEPLETTVSESGKKASAELGHFSRYMLTTT